MGSDNMDKDGEMLRGKLIHCREVVGVVVVRFLVEPVEQKIFLAPQPCCCSAATPRRMSASVKKPQHINRLLFRLYA